MLENRDYTLIIDKSGSMATADVRGKSRWSAVQESAQALAAKCEQFDPDGITLYVFSGRFRRYDNVTNAKVTQVFQENEPVGSTNLAAVLEDAFKQHFDRKAQGQARPETILVITDGAPDDQRAVMKSIIDATRKMQNDDELAISFLQVGGDAGAAKFLKVLDDELSRAGAAFDIVDTISVDEMEDMTLSEVLLNAIKD